MQHADAPVTVIRNAAWAVIWNGSENRHVYGRNLDIAFSGREVVAIGERLEGGGDAVVIDGSNRMVMPGLIDVHCHPCWEPLRKSLTEEAGSGKLWQSPLYEYLAVLQAEGEGIEAAHEVALCELLQSGVTTLCDLTPPHDGWIDTLAASGIRGVAAPRFASARFLTKDGRSVSYDWRPDKGRSQMEEAFRVIREANVHPSGRLTGMVAPAHIDTTTPEILCEAADRARELGMPLQIHGSQSVSEFHEIMQRHGMTPIAWLDSLGVLGPNVSIGHCIFLDHHSWLQWPTRDDLSLLARTGASIVHCPTQYCRIGAVLESFDAYRAAGVNIALGTDTYPHNMLDEMRTCAICARIAERRVDAGSTASVFEAATIGGAKALGRTDIGRIAVGAKADLVLVDLDHPAMQPAYDPMRALIFSASDRAVTGVFVDGREVVKNAKAIAFDYEDAARRTSIAQCRLLENVPRLDFAGRSAEDLIPRSFELVAAI